MTAQGLEERLRTVEREVKRLKAAVKKIERNQPPWWERLGGIFRDDEEFDRIAQAGRRYRRSLAHDTDPRH